MKIPLKEAAKIITDLSGFIIDRDSIRNLIINKRWPYPTYRCEWETTARPTWLVEVKDAKKFAKTFKGFKLGRPRKKTY